MVYILIVQVPRQLLDEWWR